MTSKTATKQRLQMGLSLFLIVIGLALMIMMIVVEDELGAIPLLLITIGAGWFFLARRRAKVLHK